MKKNFFYSAMAVVMTLFASCTQDEIVSTSQVGDNMVRLSVNVSGAQPNTRAAQSLDVTGYKMRCIAQAVNTEGTLISDFNEIVAVENGAAHFEFEAPEGVAKYVFWADYVAEGADVQTASGFYNVADLTNVGYTTAQDADLFNNQAADAFCGNVEASKVSSGNITLKRPFARLAVRQSQATEAGLTGLTNIIPTINAGAGFNVATGAATTTVTVGLAESETLTALTEGDFYFFCYAFKAPESTSENTTIQFNSNENQTGKTINITAEQMQSLTANNNVNLIEKGTEGTTINVDLVIDNSYGDDPVLKVGAYVNAAGEPVATAAEAKGIVFHMGALGDDVPANYPEALQSKTIAAYAVALTNVAASRQQLNAEAVADGYTPTEVSVTNGTQAMEAFNTNFANSAFLTSYNTWVENNTLSGENVSAWYIPTVSQLQAFMGMLFTIGETTATGSEEFRGMDEFALTYGVMFDRTPIATVYYMSSTVNAENNPSGVRINVGEDGTVTNAQAAGLNAKTSAQSALCRPMFTIFE